MQIRAITSVVAPGTAPEGAPDRQAAARPQDAAPATDAVSLSSAAQATASALAANDGEAKLNLDPAQLRELVTPPVRRPGDAAGA